MSDATRNVSLSKGGQLAAPASARPTTVLITAVACALAGVFSFVAEVSLLGQKTWILKQLTTSNAKLAKNKQVSHEKLVQDVNSAPSHYLLTGVLALVIFAAIAFFVYRGRYWARWLPAAIFVLSVLQQLPASPLGLILLGKSDVPAGFRFASVLAALALIVAVVASNLKPSVAFFALTKPARPAGAAPRRGLFGPRPTPASPPAATAPRGTVTASSADRSRAKKRASLANADAVAKGADLARARARSSKSRRTEG